MTLRIGHGMFLLASVAMGWGVPAQAPFAAQPPKDVYLAKRIAEIREATARYRDLRVAEAAGYARFSGNLPLLGYRFVHPAITAFDFGSPAGLIYVLQGERWQLVGVEYSVPGDRRPDAQPFAGIGWTREPATCRYADGHELESPRRDGCPARHPEGSPLASWHPTRWVIRAWVWYPNPAGLFAPVNSLLAPFHPQTLPPEGLWTWESWQQFAAFSRRNHQMAGWLVLAMAATMLLQAFEVPGAPWLRAVWTVPPMVLGILIVVLSDRDAWPVGEMTFVQTLADEGAREHKFSGILVLSLGLVEFFRARGALVHRAWGLFLPALAVTAGGILLGHDHTVDNFSFLGRANLPHITEGITAILIGVTKLLHDWRLWRGRLAASAWPALAMALAVQLLLFRE
jgi:putative copper resistance protein D